MPLPSPSAALATIQPERSARLLHRRVLSWPDAELVRVERGAAAVVPDTASGGSFTSTS